MRVARRGIVAIGIGACLLALSSPPAESHGRSVSYSSWRLEGDGAAEVTVRLTRLELSRLPELVRAAGAPFAQGHGDPIGAYLAAHIGLERGGVPCPAVEPPRPLSSEPGSVRYRWSIRCGPGSGPLAIRSSLLLEAAPSHLHFARLIQDERATDAAAPSLQMRERVLTGASPTWTVSGGDSEARSDAEGTSLGEYVMLGVEHILTGWDHLAFVLGLLLLSRRVGEIARLVTGFTVAHSLTLAFAVLGWVDPRGPVVEAVIGFSVALVAAEYVWERGGSPRIIPATLVAGLLALAVAATLGATGLPVSTLLGLALFCGCYFEMQARAARPERLRILLTFAFGLVHGFGFAGVLMQVHLPAERLVPALFGFNAGVELGQLAVVCVLWPLLLVGDRISERGHASLLREVLAAGVAGLGLFWFVERSLIG